MYLLKLKMGDYLTEEINGRVTRFINYMLEAPNAIDDIRRRIPNGLSCASKTDNALTQSEFNTMVSYETYDAKIDDSIPDPLSRIARVTTLSVRES